MTAGLLVLADGTTFEGESVGRAGACTGEVVFNTALSGYQEILTDPSYAGQVVCFTYPHIGNYGVTDADNESRRPFCRGVIVRDLARRPSNWRAEESLAQFLDRHHLGALTGIDTRRLTRHLREVGSMPGAFGPVEGPDALDPSRLAALAAAEPTTEGRDLVSEVTTLEPYRVGDGPRRVVAYDFGIKTHILRYLTPVASVTVVPAHTSAAEVLDQQPDGVFLSNGPGDPSAVPAAAQAVAGLVGRVPIFGICLGHQVLAAALGAKTYKLAFGHHGANHPVRHLGRRTVEITSQNHNYAVVDGPADRFDVTHRNLNDGVIEGLRVPGERAFSVQYHPEAGPGPHDARYLFEEFRQLMDGEAS